jgi:septal ring factor EnvC (AmiA/AmiB activator)
VYELARGKYDLVVDTGPSFTSRREETVQFLTEVIRANPATAPLLMDVMARNMDFPESEKVAARFQAMLPPPVQALERSEDEPADPGVLMQQLAQAQMQMQQMGQALQAAQSDMAAAQLKAQTEREKTQAQGQQHMQDLMAEREAKEAEMRLQAELKQAELAVQREQNLLELAADILKAQNAANAQAAQDADDAERAAMPAEPDASSMALAGMMEMLAQTVAGLQQTMALAAAPKRVIRDPATGRAMGVETVQGPMQ